MFQAMAVHHAAPEHVEEFKEFMRRVRAATEGAAGLVEFTSWQDADDPTRLIGLARWERPEDFAAALPRIGSLSHERREEWSAAPDELFTMTAV